MEWIAYDREYNSKEWTTETVKCPKCGAVPERFEKLDATPTFSWSRMVVWFKCENCDAFFEIYFQPYSGQHHDF